MELTSGLASKRVPEIVETLSRKSAASDKENEDVRLRRKKKRQKFEAESRASAFMAGPPLRRALESKSVNVALSDQGTPRPSSSGYGSRKENGRINVAETVQRSAERRPPWKYVTAISTNNRHAATIAERVGVNPATTNASTTINEVRELPEMRKTRGRSSLPASGRASKAEVTMSSAAVPPTRSASARDDIDYVKTFCVDVRPDPSRPWKLTPKKANPARPLVMFPNPTFKPNPEQVLIENPVNGRTQQGLGPKLIPFRSFHLMPLKLASLQQQQQQQPPLPEASPVTIRPYLSPSKTSPRPSRPVEDEDPLASLVDSRSFKPAAAQSLSAINSERSRNLKLSSKENLTATMAAPQKERWLSKRLSLPCSPVSPKSFLKRFPLLNTSRGRVENAKFPPVVPVPSLAAKLPTRAKPSHIDSKFVFPSPLPRRTKSLSNSISGTPLVSPLSPPPGLRLLASSKTKNVDFSPNGRSLSCQPHTDHESQRRLEQRDGVTQRSFSSGLREAGQSAKKKQLVFSVPGCNGSSVWPSMKRSSSCQSESVDCTQNCTGAGPHLFKHVKGWIQNKNSLSLQGHTGSSYGGKRRL
ncbi:hypothetical protein KP509_11G073800 [Ceratopteris richardii]|nr:hypothetical protein KP509_11G073800 [Ceratopteris richardii]